MNDLTGQKLLELCQNRVVIRGMVGISRGNENTPKGARWTRINVCTCTPTKDFVVVGYEKDEPESHPNNPVMSVQDENSVPDITFSEVESQLLCRASGLARQWAHYDECFGSWWSTAQHVVFERDHYLRNATDCQLSSTSLHFLQHSQVLCDRIYVTLRRWCREGQHDKRSIDDLLCLFRRLEKHICGRNRAWEQVAVL